VNFVVAVNNFGDTRSGGLAGPMGLFVIVLMCIATVMLIRNMSKRIRRLPDKFQDAEAAERQAEIAHLDADLALPGIEPDRPQMDSDRADVPAPPAQAEVNDGEAADRRSGRRGTTDRA
jgi:hypothetical protein